MATQRPIAAKGRNAYLTIREAADALGLEPSALRFWETQFDQLQPLRRSGGRRFYSPEDMALLARIRELLHEKKYTIKGAQEALAAPEASPSLPPSAEVFEAPEFSFGRRAILRRAYMRLKHLQEMLATAERGSL